MPEQDLTTGAPTRSAVWDPAARRRRMLVTATLGLTAAASVVMSGVLAPGGHTPLDILTLALFVILFGWVAFSFLSAVAGFVVAWRAPDRDADPQPIIFGRTALLLPTYNEDPGRILAAAQAILEQLAAMGVGELYDLFVLSDTRDDEIARAEAVGVVRLRTRLGEGARVFYRRRPRNTDKKAGNITDWVTRFGGDYPFMLILDADSLMSADTIVRLTAAMEADPKLGLLQTAPSIVNGETLFARLQQFACRTYGPMLAAGQDWWSGAEGNYWGHNAILRTRAFAECAGLPHLPGRKPFGGHIMSHDFVEAALLRRGGWSVRLDAGLEGSFEEGPPTILDMARRDRRWCQGNLQHAGVLRAAGLHWVNRLHMVRGILSYVTAPLWLLLLAGAGVWIEQSAPTLDAQTVGTATGLFGVTLALLFAPKFMAGALVLKRQRDRSLLGTLRLGVSIVAESVASALVAPVLMLMQSVAVVDVLLGRDAGWNVQQRDQGRLSRKEAWRAHRVHVLIGIVGAGLACALDPVMFWWTSPVYLGLALSAPMSAVFSRPEPGRIARSLGLFVTPEELREPPIVERANDLRAIYDSEETHRRDIERAFRTPAAIYRPTPFSAPVDTPLMAAE